MGLSIRHHPVRSDPNPGCRHFSWICSGSSDISRISCAPPFFARFLTVSGLDFSPFDVGGAGSA
jgi:hypothetical protein